MKKLILILTLFLCRCVSQRQLTYEEQEDLHYEEYWKSIEEHIIPYKDPVAKKWRRYFPDFYMKVKEANGKVQSYLVEVKPLKQTKCPKPRRVKTKAYLSEVMTYATNAAKWESAIEYCDDRGWKFKLITERELEIK